MNWCNKLTGNTCELIIHIMSTLPTAAQRLYKKLNIKFYFLILFYTEISLNKEKALILLFNFSCP